MTRARLLAYTQLDMAAAAGTVLGLLKKLLGEDILDDPYRQEGSSVVQLQMRMAQQRLPD